jgi:kumamolisin
MRHRTLGSLFPAGLALAVLMATTSGVPRVFRPTEPNGAPPTLRAPRMVTETSRDQHLRFGLNLAVRQRALDAYLSRLYDPSSSTYRRFIDAKTFGTRFGLSSEALSLVTQRLRDAGFAVRSFPQHTSLDVEGTVGQVEDFFDTRIANFVDVSGDRFHAPLADPVIPEDLKASVAAVTGLSSRARSKPADIPADGLKPTDLATAYNIKPLWDLGYTGEGQTVAIFSQFTFDDSDMAGFDQTFNTQGPAPEHIAVNGGTTEKDLEVNLDIDTVRAVAPKAQMLVYEIPDFPGGEPQSYAEFESAFAQGVATVVNQVVADHRAQILSISYGTCDVPDAGGAAWLPAADRLAGETALKAAAAAGINVFVSAGDGAAYTCQHWLPRDLRVTAAWPGDSPWVISVGGTYLRVRQDASYLDEAGWGNPLSRWGTGGGLNPQDARPSWQQGPGVANAASNGRRQFPDVAAAGDSGSGYQVFFQGRLHRVGGTSGSAPFWAGVMALVQQTAANQGIKKLGFASPMLYDLAANPPSEAPFHDVTKGSNLYYSCTAGWDYATGLGSPDAFNLARAAVTYLKSHPPQ